MEIPVVTAAASEEVFRTQLQPAHRPVILRGLAVGPCTDTWKDWKYLLDKTEDRPVKIHVVKPEDAKRMDFKSKNFKYQVASLHDLIKRILAEDQEDQEPLQWPQEKYYLRWIGDDPRGQSTANLKTDFPMLSSDFCLPEFFDADRLFSSVLRISSPGLRVWTHYDVMDNLYVQVAGHKDVVMWAPDQADYLYLDGDKSRVVDIDAADVSVQFPLFNKAKKWLGSLVPGDVLYIPALWFHNMTAVDAGVAVNVFWKNLSEELYDKKDPYGNRDLLPAAKAMRMLDNVVRQLDGLPQEYRDFYGRQLIARLGTKCLNSNDDDDDDDDDDDNDNTKE